MKTKKIALYSLAVLVAGLLEGNRQVRDHQDACLDVVAKALIEQDAARA